MPEQIDTGRLLRKMAREWDARARENARYYVSTASECWSDEQFFQSGEETAARDV